MREWSDLNGDAGSVAYVADAASVGVLLTGYPQLTDAPQTDSKTPCLLTGLRHVTNMVRSC
jgi:hypothetical protein